MRKIWVWLIAVLMSFSFGIANAASSFGATLCKQPGYYCQRVSSGDTWENLFNDPNKREIVRKINRSNLPLRPGMVLAVPTDLATKTLLDFAPFDAQISPIGQKLVLVKPSILAWAAYSADGHLVNWGAMAGGKDFCPDVQKGCRTSVGSFKVYAKGGPACTSGVFPIPKGGAPMPYCMFFNNGIALHASPEVPGYHASHGCVRLFYEDAQWLNLNFVDVGTKVVVKPYNS